MTNDMEQDRQDTQSAFTLHYTIVILPKNTFDLKQPLEIKVQIKLVITCADEIFDFLFLGTMNL